MKKYFALLKIKPSIFLRGAYCYRPMMIEISKKAKVSFAKNVHINQGWTIKRILKNKKIGELYVQENAKLSIGKNAHVRQGVKLSVNKNAKLTIGENVLINENTKIESFKEISIGNNSLIGEEVLMRDTNGHTIITSDNNGKDHIVIQDNVWIGARTIILPGVTIGSGSVIGAGSILTKSIPPKSLAVGAPARVIKENIKWRR